MRRTKRAAGRLRWGILSLALIAGCNHASSQNSEPAIARIPENAAPMSPTRELPSSLARPVISLERPTSAPSMALDAQPSYGIDDQVYRLPMSSVDSHSPPAAPSRIVSREVTFSTSNHPTPGLSQSAAMKTARSQAREAIDHGFFLANRGATYSAQAEFSRALEMIAQARDVDESGSNHVIDFQDGLAALREEEDFAVVASSADSDALRVLSASHRTPVLRRMEHAEALTVNQAAGLYATYAQDKLLAAVGLDPVASVALVGLGKSMRVIEHRQPELDLIAAGQAAACYQAALRADPKNFHAAHELGTLLANLGENQQASVVLNCAIGIHPTPESWTNLAVVYQRLGRADLAGASRLQAQHLIPTQARQPYQPRLVDTKTFAASAPSHERSSAPKGASTTDAARHNTETAAKPNNPRR